MSDAMKEMGAIVAMALSKANEPAPVPTVTAEVRTPDVNVNFDSGPFARQLKASADQNAEAIQQALAGAAEQNGADIRAGLEAVGEAFPETPDLSGVEAKLGGLIAALSEEGTRQTLTKVVVELQRQNALLEAQIDAIGAQTAAIRAEKTIRYDSSGRITSVAVV